MSVAVTTGDEPGRPPDPPGPGLPGPSVADLVAAAATRQGPLRFDAVMDLALYHPRAGFYATAGGPGGSGRRGDFLTSPEVGPLFGAVLARALDAWWEERGRPDPYLVAEAGAGPGTLAAAVAAAEPRCGPALRYLLVDRVARWRGVQARALALEAGRDVAGGPPGRGPVFASTTDLPSGEGLAVVVANELLDNLRFRVLARGRGGGWDEVFVDRDGGELLVPTDPAAAAWARGAAPDAEPGARVPRQEGATDWLRSTLAGLDRGGRVVVLDYADTTAGMAARPWREWLRTYRGHGRGGEPLDDLGAQDLTAPVALDQLTRVAEPAGESTQAQFLAGHGLTELEAEARTAWTRGAAAGDLPALRARSRLGEARALVDPAGLGAFRVLEWIRR